MPRPPPFADLDAALAALDSKALRANPSRSVVTLLGEARRLHALAEPLRARFAALAEFDVAAIDQLPELIARAQRAEIALTGVRIAPEHVSLHKTRDEAISLRWRLTTAARRLFPDDPRLRRATKLQQRRSLPSLVADLRSLASLANEHPDAFAAVPALPDKPAEAASKLADTLVRGDWHPLLDKALGERNAAMALLAMALQEVRSGGRFLFRYEPELLERFSDRVSRARRRKRSRVETEDTGTG